jgi:hypothetical protein
MLVRLCMRRSDPMRPVNSAIQSRDWGRPDPVGAGCRDRVPWT